jgi:hypothetical protein
MGLLQKMGSMAHSELHSHGDAIGLGRVEPANGVWTNAQSSVFYTRDAALLFSLMLMLCAAWQWHRKMGEMKGLHSPCNSPHQHPPHARC